MTFILGHIKYSPSLSMDIDSGAEVFIALSFFRVEEEESMPSLASQNKDKEEI